MPQLRLKLVLLLAVGSKASRIKKLCEKQSGKSSDLEIEDLRRGSLPSRFYDAFGLCFLTCKVGC